MPPVIVALAAAAAGAAATAAAGAIIGGTIAGYAFLATAAASLIGAVVATAVGYGLSAAFGLNRVKKSSPSVAAQDRKQTIRSSIAPRQIVYGTVRVSGPIIYASSSGTAKEFLHLVIPVAGHRISDILAIWINDVRIPKADIDATTKLVTAGQYAGLVRFEWENGAQTTANAALVAASTDGWSADHVLRGTAYVYLRLQYDRDVFSSGPGAISFEVAGHNQILDVRTSTTGYSTNPALCILHYLTSADGLACAADEIDTASFIAAANICDEFLQVVEGGGTQERYRLDGAFTLDVKPLDVIEDMMTSCGGTLVYIAGKYRLFVGAYDAPTDSIGEADLAGAIELVTKPPRRELFNTVRGTFINPARNWQASEFPAYSESQIVTADGEVIETEIEFPFTTDEIRAQRLAKLTLRRAREALTVRVPVKYAGIRFAVWQTLSVTMADFGWTNKPFRIVSWAFDAQAGIVNLTLREESAASYAWQFGDASPLPLAPDTDLVDPLAIPAPTGVTLTASSVLQSDGSIAPALLVEWTAAAFAFVIAHEVQWRIGEGEWNSAQVPLGTNRYLIAPVLVGSTYQVRVRAVTGIARGAWSGTVSTAATGDATTPSGPTSLAAVGILRGIALTWTLPTATDFAAVEVYENTSSSTTGRYFVGESTGTSFVRTGLASAVTRWFWVRSRDRSGNLSAFVGPVSATSLRIETADITAGAIDTEQFAFGVRPVEIVSTLPVSSLTDGRVVFLTTDKKLYRYKAGTGWAKDVDGSDLVAGTVSAAAIASGAITTSKLAVTGGSLLLDGSFDDTAGFWTVEAGGFIIEDNTGANAVASLGVRRGAVLFSPTYSGATQKVIATPAFSSCAEGQVYRLRARGLNTNSTRTVFVQLYAVNSLGALVGSAANLSWLDEPTASNKDVQFTVPAGGVRLQIGVVVVAGAAWTGTAAVGDITVVQAATGAMIVDGTITAGKIFAGTITANEIEVEGITKTVSAQGSNQFLDVELWNDVMTTNYTCTNGARRVILISVECSDESAAGVPNADGADWQSFVRMKIGGTVQAAEVDTHCSNGTTTALTWSFLDDVTTRSGSVAFVLEGYAQNFPGATRTKTGWRDPTITILEFKR